MTGSKTAGFRGSQVCNIVGITYRQLDYWARSGLLVPSIMQAGGTGSSRCYSYLDIVRLRVIKRLLDSGVSLQRARKAISCLEEDLGEDLGSANLVMEGASTILAKTEEAMFDLLKAGQGVFNIVPIGSVVQEVDAAIASLSDDRSHEINAQDEARTRAYELALKAN